MRIDRLTIATTHTGVMVRFYNAVFDAQLKPIPESPLYIGHIGELGLLFCPNEILGIVAEKNRIQFRMVVEDTDAIASLAEANGGGPYGERVESDTHISWGIHDPDENSIEMVSTKYGDEAIR